MPHRIIRLGIVPAMRPHELVAALIRASGLSTVQLAKDMGQASFQGSLHKIAHGLVASPKRASADRIARYFEIPVDALYDAKVAARVAAERGLLAYENVAPLPAAAPAAREPAPPAYLPSEGRRLPIQLQQRIAALSSNHFEQLVQALDALVTGYEAQRAQPSKRARS